MNPIVQKLGLLVTMLLTVLCASAYDFEVDGIYYGKLSSEEAMVTYRTTSYDSYYGDVTIPEAVEYDGVVYSVTQIGEKAFYRCTSLRSVSLPYSIKKIGLLAFSDSKSLAKVFISDLTAWCEMECDFNPLSYGAVLYLDGKPIESLEHLSNSCTKIRKDAFYGQRSIKKLIIPEFIEEVGERAFSGCSNISYLEIGANVKKLGEGAFRECSSLNTIKLADSNQELSIGRYRIGDTNSYFYDSPLKTVYIGRPFSWEDTSMNYRYYYPFTKAVNVIFNCENASLSGFGNAIDLKNVYVGPRCKTLAFYGNNKVDNLFCFASDLRVESGSSCSRPIKTLHVINPTSLPAAFVNATYESVRPLVTLSGISNPPVFEYGQSIDASTIAIESEVPMEVSLSVSSMNWNVGQYTQGIDIKFIDSLWSATVNYPFSYTVEKAPLTVIANDKERSYGTENPELTCSFFGFKNGETQNVLTRMPLVETTATLTSNVGSYPIIPTGAEAQNYTFNYERGILTITKANQTIEWSQQFDNATVGDVIELTASSSAGLPIKYSSTDETIAEILTQNGKKFVEFKKPGNVSIRANQEGNDNYNEADRVSKYAKVNLPTYSITLTPTSVTLVEGKSTQLIATVSPESAIDKTVTWKSDNEDVAIVSSNGTVTGVSAGTANITATCGNASATCKVRVNPVTATSVTLSVQYLSLLVGQSDKLTATVSPENTTDKTVTWNSDNEYVAIVSSNGTVTGVSAGTANITATCGNASATCKVRVNPVTATSVTLSVQYLSLLVGQSDKLTATVSPENTTDKTVTWVSSNSQVATVDSEGNVKGLTRGNCTITATAVNGGHTAECQVTVIQPVEAINITPKYLSLKAGESSSLSVSVIPANANNKSVPWISEDESIAKVDQLGNVTAIAGGRTKISAKSNYDNSLNDFCEITVTQPVTGITLSQNSAEISVDGSLQLIATVLPDNSSNKNVTWSSSDLSVAMVSGNGIVYGIKAGQATIMATTEDGGFSALCKISVKDGFIPISEIALNQTSIDGNIGDTFQLTASILPENASNKTLIWQSDNESVASVDNNGLVRLLNSGVAMIKASATDGSGTYSECKVTVNKVLVTSITLSETTKEMAVGEEFQLFATILPDNATSKNVEWKSTNESIAIVDNKGVVKALKQGECEVSVTAMDGSETTASCKIKVYKYSAIEDVIADDKENIAIYSAHGFLLFKGTHADLPQLNNGIYIVQTDSGKTIKLIINN